MTREWYLLQLVASYIKFDKVKRLKDATDLFMLLRLVLIVDYLDFKSLNLEELENPEAFPDLHRALILCRVPPDTCLLSTWMQNMWLPRSESIKYSVLTWNRCAGLPSKYFNNGSKLGDLTKALEAIFGISFTEKFMSEKMAEEPSLQHVTKKFSMENEGAYIVGIDVFTSTSGLTRDLVDGIRLRWSDGTFHQAGCTQGICHPVSFQPPRTATITVWVASRVVVTAVMVTTWTTHGQGRVGVRSHGPFGKPVGVKRETLLTNKLFASKPYLDGIYGCELDVRGQTLLCDLSFKTSFFVNFPLYKRSEPLYGRVFSTPEDQFYQTTLKFLRQTHHVIKVCEFRALASAAIYDLSLFCGSGAKPKTQNPKPKPSVT